MANKGYIMFTLDNRGSDNRGLEFENVTFRHLGIEEAAHLPTLFVPSERAKNSWEQAGCVPLPPRKAAKTRKALQTLAFLLLRRTLYPLGQQRNAPCALSGRRGRKAASTACRDAKICKFDFLKIHLLKFIYVNLIF